MPGPSGDCLPYLAPQKSLRQRCQLITDYTGINMQRRQEDLGCCLTSLATKKCCTGCYHHGDGRKRHKLTQSPASTSTLFTLQSHFRPTISFLATRYFFHYASSFKMEFTQYEKCLEEENAVSVWQVYSPRRASHLLSGQLLKTRFSSERLPFAPVLKLKFKGKAPVECDWEEITLFLITNQ